MAGHITYRQPDGTFLVNPLDLSWDELCAGDVARMDAQGHQIEGPWNISPAVRLHVVLHEHRENAGVVIHNHPRWGTIWADSHRIPPVYDQTSALYGGKIAIDATYDGPVNQTVNAYFRAAVVEWRCRQAWHVEALGSGVPMDDKVVKTFGAQIAKSVASGNFDNWFAAAARRIVRHDPAVLD